MTHYLSISPKQSQIIKGIAILIMIYHHFFGGYAVPMDLETVKATDHLFEFFSRFARSGKICISFYAFISGYALCYIISKENKRLISATWNRLRKVYLFFIFMCILIYTLISIFPCPISFNLSGLFIQLSGYKSSIPDYWYISVVLTSILIYFPILLLGYWKGNTMHAMLCYTLMTINMSIAVSPYMYNTLKWDFMLPLYKLHNMGLMSEVVLTMPFFMLGYSLNHALKTRAKQDIILFAAAIVFCFFAYNPKWAFVILACVVVTNSVLSKLTIVGSPLAYLGKYSMCMWLNHRLIFGYWFADCFYSLPTPLNYILIVLLSLALSILITKTYESSALFIRRHSVKLFG